MERDIIFSKMEHLPTIIVIGELTKFKVIKLIIIITISEPVRL